MDNEKKVVLETIDGERIELNVQKDKLPKRVWSGIKTGVTNTINKTKEFVCEHPLATTIIVSSGIKIFNTVITGYCKCQNAKNKRLQSEWGEQKLYDRKYDVYYNLKRPMTSLESAEYSRRREMGETTYDILFDMNLI